MLFFFYRTTHFGNVSTRPLASRVRSVGRPSSRGFDLAPRPEIGADEPAAAGDSRPNKRQQPPEQNGTTVSNPTSEISRRHATLGARIVLALDRFYRTAAGGSTHTPSPPACGAKSDKRRGGVNPAGMAARTSGQTHGRRRVSVIRRDLPARGLVGVDMGCVPPSFVLNDRPAPNSGPGTFPDFDLGHAPDCIPGPRSVFN
ncbi:hypothetical protein EVAR_22251_1 [Eumeta japonica]|uniref:Uncharacterized protein n=1 Tax=Eumeta variegata TaxID=151549 RepID=A0A4C1UAC8_EUMVA|nr:hypothetical protein EVAR_22251_1 [Eumeta japonica]